MRTSFPGMSTRVLLRAITWLPRSLLEEPSMQVSQYNIHSHQSYEQCCHCRYHLNTRAPYIRLNMQNQEMNVAGQRCEDIMECPIMPFTFEKCPYDVLRVYDGETENDPLIGAFCGMGSVPFFHRWKRKQSPVGISIF